MLKREVKSAINKYMYRRNRTHYLKWTFGAEWSVRFIFTYDARKQYEMKWVLKSHTEKIYIILKRSEAEAYIRKYAKNIEPKEYFSMYEFGKGYRRTVIDPKVGADCYIENKNKRG